MNVIQGSVLQRLRRNVDQDVGVLVDYATLAIRCLNLQLIIMLLATRLLRLPLRNHVAAVVLLVVVFLNLRQLHLLQLLLRQIQFHVGGDLLKVGHAPRLFAPVCQLL